MFLRSCAYLQVVRRNSTRRLNAYNRHEFTISDWINYLGPGNITKMLKLKYNQNSAYKYQQKLSLIRQKDYYTIRAYLQDIKNTCLKLSICLNWNKPFFNQRLNKFSFVDSTKKFNLK
ncbi:hypothetical protein DMUE_2568 [Dictyocoela muelleri]|nr:hypothetical protein DMUE_2568 [Dictyocoela muelleri]